MHRVLEALSRKAVVGHRGFPRRRPENTIASFVAAVEAGADIIEMDVWKTADDVVVVIHDGAVTAPDGVLKVKEARWRELSGYRVDGEPIPTLEGALQAVAGRAGVFVEVKDPEAAGLVGDVLRRVGAASWTAVISFHEEALVPLKGLVPLGLIYAKPPGRIADARRLGLDLVLPHHRLATARAVDFAHRMGLKVVAWTVNDGRTMEGLWSRGVDGIASDDVELAVSVRNKFNR
ncbi:MAG: glycerophosphodiester phosphodiesterase [Thermoproteus sp.]|jgi:glycerophosphoryl diester phosphodiesterase|uniref:glycerophosphodiester phosphodiesterase n=1 Tax=Thermoproteus sp. CP80 TaxID=1650659 RepID=UPI0009BE9554|nr:glycerophosphodiester phosphodiesterase [Thermoproteus sp. CP80]PLC66032.1 glycerophosphodiester phosphodiesterase [Thermoproteus sp. CP80]